MHNPLSFFIAAEPQELERLPFPSPTVRHQCLYTKKSLNEKFKYVPESRSLHSEEGRRKLQSKNAEIFLERKEDEMQEVLVLWVWRK
jgi:hypothetical protein